MNNPDSLQKAVDGLILLLNEETEALRCLDHARLDALTLQKTQLLNEIASLRSQRGGSPSLGSIKQLRELTLRNQMLMVHARDLTQGVFDRLTGHAHGGKGAGGRLLEVRG